ncbi:MAG: Transposase like [Thermoanaerobaculia bacterium]|nr:Transposase like [Thermoanaerobaculia bacterium]
MSAARRDIYGDDFDRHRFLKLLARTIVDRRWILHAWVLMSNHNHLHIETPEVGLPSWNEVAQSAVCRVLQRASPQSR